jgi:hypothetical protein
MFTAGVSFLIATTLSFHPYAVGGRAAPATTAAEPAPSAAPNTASGTTTPPPPPRSDAAPAWEDEPVAEPPPPRAPPGAEADARVDAKAEETHEVVRPKTRKGVGLMVGAGIAGATAWGLTIGKIVLADRCNDSIQEGGNVMDAEVTVYKCFTNIKSILGLSVAGWFANWTTWGLAAGAGGVRGKHDGVSYAWDGRPRHSAAGFIGSGAALFGVGVIGVGLSRGLALTTLFKCDVDVEINNCATKTFRGYFAAVQVSSTLVAAGLGLMVYGLVYRKHRTMFKDRAVSQLQIVPDVSVYRTSGNYNGLALTGKF